MGLTLVRGIGLLVMQFAILVSLSGASGESLLINSDAERAVFKWDGGGKDKEEASFTLRYGESVCPSVSAMVAASNGECVQESVSYARKNKKSGSTTLVKHFRKLKLDVTESLLADNWLQRRLRTRASVCCRRIGDCALNCTTRKEGFREPLSREAVRPDQDTDTKSGLAEMSALKWDLTLNETSGCLDISKRDGVGIWNLRCSAELRAENMVFDEYNWILFFVDKNEGRLMSIGLSTGVERDVVGREDFGDLEGNLPGRVAVDPIEKRVYWLTGKSVNSIHYTGGDVSVPVILHLLDEGTENTLLTYEGGSMYWLETRGEAKGIVKLEKEGVRPERFLELGMRGEEDVIGFLIHPAVERESACDAAPCSHFCLSESGDITKPGKNYQCWCPQSLPILKKGFDCQLPSIILATTRDSDPTKMVLDYAFPREGADGADRLFPVVEEVGAGDIDNFAFTVNSRINTVCWASGVYKPGKCKRGGEDTVVIASSNISSAKDEVVFLDYEGDTNTFYWGSNRCLSLSSLRNVHERAFSFGCIEVDTFAPYMIWPFAPGVCICNNKIGMMNTWFHVSNRFYASTPFDLKEGNCTGLIGNFVGTIYFIHGRKIKAIKLQEMLDGTIPPVVWETDYYGGYSMDFNSDHLFWIGSTLKDGQFVDMIKVNVYEKASQSHKIFRSPPGTRMQSIRIFEPVMRVRADFHPCTPTNCSHFCLATSPVRQGTKDSFKCVCPEGLVLKDRFKCGEPPEDGAKGGTGIKSYLLAIAIILPSLLVLLIILAVLHQYRKRQRIARQSATIQELLQGNQEAADRARDEMEKVRHLPFTKIIPENELIVSRGKILGEGNFGVVYEGVYDNRAVAVKTLKNCRDLQMVSEFVLELKIMAHVGYHDNIVQFFGAETSKVSVGKMLVVLELCPNGSLESYLKRNCKYYYTDGAEGGGGKGDASGQRGDSSIVLNLNVLLSWGRQLARGMAFLEERHVVHGDLATRNVLVFNDNVIKISDFGFARNLYQYTTYVKTKQVPLPWRWGAVETLERFEFSVKSDVWAYGVTLWEIFTLGNFPFPEEGWTLEFVERLRQGLRLPEDDVVCKRIYKDVMLPCWRLNPDTRPEFKTIEEYFRSRAVNSEITM